MRLVGALLLVAMMLGSCDDSERNVITEKAPFFQTDVGYDKARVDLVVRSVQAFAQRHKMDFLISRNGEPAEFNASADSHSLNLGAMHTDLLDKGVVSIRAIARDGPTPQDKALLGEFVADVRASASPEPKSN